jgi:hypothetical protein
LKGAADEVLHLAGTSGTSGRLFSASPVIQWIANFRMASAGTQRAKTRQQIQGELLENVRRAQADFRLAGADKVMAARESYMCALDALNAFLRSIEFHGGTGQNE